MNNFNFNVPRPNMDIFRTARENFLRRQQASEEADLERQQAREVALQQHDDQPPSAAAVAAAGEMQQRSPATTILSRFADFRRARVSSFISRRSSQHAPAHQPRPSSSNYDDNGNDLESPKTPNFAIGMPDLPSTRLHLPNLARTWTQGSNGPPSRPATARSPTGRRSPARTTADRTPGLQVPVPAVPADHVRSRSDPTAAAAATRLDGPDPAEDHLATLAEDGRRRRHGRSRSDGQHPRRHRHRHRHRHHHHHSRSDGTQHSRRHRDAPADGGEPRPTARPKRFLFCFPWIRSRRIRSQILRCFVSGLFLTLLLSVYLALSITKNINNSEFTVLLILIILFTTIFFCHGLIRLCMLIMKPPSEEDERRAQAPHMYGPGGYAVPRRPIRVLLARDEEAAGIESEATKIQPPAYGLWRESVRVDPNRIYWQRNETAPPEAAEAAEVVESEGEGEPRTASRDRSAPRPPSYISDDGVSYVVEAQPRSVAPTTDVPLPQHPSEEGRTGQPAVW